jgi:hydrogenase maturation protease
VDAVSSGAEVGTVHRLDASESELPTELFRASTHHVGLAEAVELARALGRLPARTIVYGIEGKSFQVGEELAPEVAAAVEPVAKAVRKEVAQCMRRS